jgi:TM2 domain-containing membrane protein YozV
MHRRDPITQAPLNPGEFGFPEREVPSSKNYTKAVILSGVFGFMGLQHFYLRRWGEGLLDLGLTAGWLWGFLTGHLIWGAVFLVVDSAHALFVTIALLTGNFRDGSGRLVCYPGQKLKNKMGELNHGSHDARNSEYRHAGTGHQ